MISFTIEGIASVKMSRVVTTGDTEGEVLLFIFQGLFTMCFGLGNLDTVHVLKTEQSINKTDISTTMTC